MDEYIRTGDNVNKCSGDTAAPLSPLRLSLYQEVCLETAQKTRGPTLDTGQCSVVTCWGGNPGTVKVAAANSAATPLATCNMCKHQAARGGLWLVAYGVRQLTCYLQFYMFLL